MRTTPTTQGRRLRTIRMTPKQIRNIVMNKTNHIDTYTPISLARSIGGGVSIGIGIATWFIPFTTIPLLAVGTALLGYDYKVLSRTVLFHTKEVLFFIYRHRTLKLIKRTLNWRLLLWF